MKDRLLLQIRKFIQERALNNKSILIGYSGGPDSKALLYLLLECALRPHIVHIDHSWRQESIEEADAIEREAQELGLASTRFTLQKSRPGNLEAKGREERLKCFSKLYRELDSQALFLGHHADDRAEVVLKRVFEGAFLSHLEGLKADVFLRGMRILRPLLTAPKKEILSWLSQKKLNYFKDSTNLSSKFLRGRMRSEMLPYLEKQFGKNLSSNLCLLGQQSQEIEEYFSSQNRDLLCLARQESRGSVLNLAQYLPLPALQLKFLLKQWWEIEGALFPRSILENAVTAIMKRDQNKQYEANGKKMIISSGVIYLY